MSSNKLAVLAIVQFVFATWLAPVDPSTSTLSLWVLQVTSWAFYLGAFVTALVGLIKSRKNKFRHRDSANYLATVVNIIIVLLLGFGVLFSIFWLIVMRNFTF